MYVRAEIAVHVAFFVNAKCIYLAAFELICDEYRILEDVFSAGIILHNRLPASGLGDELINRVQLTDWQ